MDILDYLLLLGPIVLALLYTQRPKRGMPLFGESVWCLYGVLLFFSLILNVYIFKVILFQIYVLPTFSLFLGAVAIGVSIYQWKCVEYRLFERAINIFGASLILLRGGLTIYSFDPLMMP